MGKIQYSLLMTIGFGLISQSVQQFDDDHFPHPDTRTGPKHKIGNDNLDNANHPWPNNGDYFPSNSQPSLKQAGHLPSRAMRHTQDNDNLPHIPIDHQNQDGNHQHKDGNQVKHQIGTDNFPSPAEIKNNHFPTPTPPRANRQVDDDFSGNLITTITPINHGEDDALFPHPHARTGPKRQIIKKDGGFPDVDDMLPEIDDLQKSKVLPPVEHQIINPVNNLPGNFPDSINNPVNNPLNNLPGNSIGNGNFPDSDERLPNGDINDGRTFPNLPPNIVPQFDKGHQNEDEKQEHQISSTFCDLGENRRNTCVETCQAMKADNGKNCYCSGSCDSSNLLATCKCENPTCECAY